MVENRDFFPCQLYTTPTGKTVANIFIFMFFTTSEIPGLSGGVLVHSAKVCKNLHGYCVYCPLFNHSSSAYVTDGQTENDSNQLRSVHYSLTLDMSRVSNNFQRRIQAIACPVLRPKYWPLWRTSMSFNVVTVYKCCCDISQKPTYSDSITYGQHMEPVTGRDF